MFCKFCGAQVDDGLIFCSVCGRKLDERTGYDSMPIQQTVNTSQNPYEKKTKSGFCIISLVGSFMGMILTIIGVMLSCCINDAESGVYFFIFIFMPSLVSIFIMSIISGITGLIAHCGGGYRFLWMGILGVIIAFIGAFLSIAIAFCTVLSLL